MLNKIEYRNELVAYLRNLILNHFKVTFANIDNITSENIILMLNIFVIKSKKAIYMNC